MKTLNLLYHFNPLRLGALFLCSGIAITYQQGVISTGWGLRYSHVETLKGPKLHDNRFRLEAMYKF